MHAKPVAQAAGLPAAGTCQSAASSLACRSRLAGTTLFAGTPAVNSHGRCSQATGGG